MIHGCMNLLLHTFFEANLFWIPYSLQISSFLLYNRYPCNPFQIVLTYWKYQSCNNPLKIYYRFYPQDYNNKNTIVPKYILKKLTIFPPSSTSFLPNGFQQMKQILNQCKRWSQTRSRIIFMYQSIHFPFPNFIRIHLNFFKYWCKYGNQKV